MARRSRLQPPSPPAAASRSDTMLHKRPGRASVINECMNQAFLSRKCAANGTLTSRGAGCDPA